MNLDKIMATKVALALSGIVWANCWRKDERK